jgi:chemotaxis-related protein WspD
MTLVAATSSHTEHGADCYKRIGVQGDRSCPELREHSHCRNCPVYAAIARGFFDREPPGDHGGSSAHRSSESAAGAAELESWLIFRAGVEWLALPTPMLDEVARVPLVRSLPHRRGGAVLGLVNVRGELVVCVSLLQVLGAEAARSDADRARSQQRLLVLRRGASRFAAPVDEVHGTRRIGESELMPPPATIGRSRRAFTRRVLPWADKTVGCLDHEALFSALEQSCT